MILREKMPDGLQKKIADKYNVTPARVRQIFEKGVYNPLFKETSIEAIDDFLEEIQSLCAKLKEEIENGRVPRQSYLKRRA